MDKKLRAYESYLKETITDFSTRKSVPVKDMDRLLNLHRDKVREFQHERLIHLLITLFFAGLLLMFCGALIACMQLVVTLATPLFFIVIILLVLELFYIHHYYQLENGVQRLEAQTEIIYELSLETHPSLKS